MTDEQIRDVNIHALHLLKACNQCCIAAEEIERVSLFMPLENVMLAAMERLVDVAAVKSRELTRLYRMQPCGILLAGCAVEAAANNVREAQELIKKTAARLEQERNTP